MQVGKSKLIQKFGTDYRCMIGLQRPGTPRVSARYAGCVCAADRILRIIIEEPINVKSKHERLIRCQPVIQTSIKEKLSIVTRVVKAAIRRQHTSRQGTR